MKTTTLSSAAIIAALALGTLTPTVALADATALDSTGTVTVEEGGGEDSPGTVDPEKPDEILPAPHPDGPGENVNPNKGALMVERTSNLNFGTIKTSANEVTSFAEAPTFGTGENRLKRGNYIQWRDIRAGGTFGYDLTVEMSQQFTGTGTNTTKLVGSTIDFSNGKMVAQGDNTNKVPGTVASAFQLTEGGGAQKVVTADRAGQEGKGRYIMAFGESEKTADTSVKLTIPGATASNMVVGNYTAKVTWKIVAAPTPTPTP